MRVNLSGAQIGCCLIWKKVEENILDESLYCTLCGEVRSESEKFCGDCANELNKRMQSNEEIPEVLNSQKEPEQNQIPENEQENALLKAFVGERKQSYYLGKWQRVNRQSFNWAALFGTFFWLGYRKMYKIICYILLLFIALDLVILLTGIDGDPINRYIGFGVAGALGAGGNSIYKNYAQKEIEKMKKEYSDDHLLEKVKQRGGGSWKGVWIGVALFIGYVAISVALDFVLSPNY